MKLSELKNNLKNLSSITFKLPDGTLVPAHFHVTEVGLITKRFIDCGGSLRNEEKISLQLFEATDYDHRLHPEKLVAIITLSEKELQLPDAEIEVEHQGSTIGKYNLDFSNGQFLLTSTTTDCLAKDKCGIPVEKPKVKLSELTKNQCCTPNSGCC